MQPTNLTDDRNEIRDETFWLNIFFFLELCDYFCGLYHSPPPPSSRLICKLLYLQIYSFFNNDSTYCQLSLECVIADIFVAIVFVFVSSLATIVFLDVWLALLTKRSEEDQRNETNLITYGCLVVGTFLLAKLWAFAFLWASLRCSEGPLR